MPRKGPLRPLAPGFEQLVTVRQLRLLTEVADRGGVTKAAESLLLSQPAVSHQLKALSVAVGIPLFETVGRRSRLTEAGEVLLEYARRILAEFEAAGEALDEVRGLRRGRLRLVGDTTVGIYVLPDILGAFRLEHPAIEVHLDIGNRQHVLDRLVANAVDFAVSGRPWDDPPIALVARPLLANELIAIASPRHPLARASRVTLEDLAAQPFIVREPGSGTRETAEEAFRQAGLSTRPAMELASNGAIKRAVAQDLGFSIVSRYAAALELEVGLLVELPVEGFPLRRQWHLVHARDKRLGPVDVAFLGFIEDGRWRKMIGRPARPRANLRPMPRGGLSRWADGSRCPPAAREPLSNPGPDAPISARTLAPIGSERLWTTSGRPPASDRRRRPCRRGASCQRRGPRR